MSATAATASGWGFSLVLPPDWVEVPLDVRRRRAINGIVRRCRPTCGSAQDPEVQRALRRALDAAADRAAAEPGAHSLHLCLGMAHGAPVPAALVIARPAPERGGLDAWEAALRTSSGSPVAPVALVVGGRPALRAEPRVPRPGGHAVLYLVSAPDDSVLVLSFSTPMESLAVPFGQLFAAVAGTVRWSRVSPPRPPARDRRPGARPVQRSTRAPAAPAHSAPA